MDKRIESISEETILRRSMSVSSMLNKNVLAWIHHEDVLIDENKVGDQLHYDEMSSKLLKIQMCN
jgi:hypothetical protein